MDWTVAKIMFDVLEAPQPTGVVVIHGCPSSVQRWMVQDANRNSDLPYEGFVHFVHPFPFSGICCLVQKAKKNTFLQI